MAKTMKVEEIVPSAARTIESLRDVGYDTPRAVADIVDNSVEAGATRVDITVHFDGADSWIRIVDNGMGMDGKTLKEAMRYGSEQQYGAESLGKFGFGLKTASTSQGRRLTVASRSSEPGSRLEVRCLDLDHIQKSEKWEILVIEGVDRSPIISEPLGKKAGTVVLWEHLDRILNTDQWSEQARQRMLQLAESIDVHLGMVFHRFLDGEVRNRKLQITVNGTKVNSWDPFSRDQEHTLSLEMVEFKIASSGRPGKVKVRPYVLPHQNQFSSTAAWRAASGPLKWNRQQGFYIYRANRLIQSGGWNRMRALDEHRKLARIAIDFSPELDSAFGINIAKAYVALPAELRTELEPTLARTNQEADKRYRNQKKPTGGGAPKPSPLPKPPSPTPGATSRSPGTTAAPTPRRYRTALEIAAKEVGASISLREIVKKLREQDHEVANELGW